METKKELKNILEEIEQEFNRHINTAKNHCWIRRRCILIRVWKEP